MREAILELCVEALRRNGHPGASAGSLRRAPAERAAALELLRACRPLPVILELIRELEAG